MSKISKHLIELDSYMEETLHRLFRKYTLFTWQSGKQVLMNNFKCTLQCFYLDAAYVKNIFNFLLVTICK